MIKILVNALSVTNPSGQHVLLGHLNQLVEKLAGRIRFVVLCREQMSGFRQRLGDRVDWMFAPPETALWLRRSFWEHRFLAQLVAENDIRHYFTPSGFAAMNLAIPQMVFCQNPWALVPAARRKRDAPKAWLQRQAYRRTMKTADVMVFNSHYMQRAYRENAGFDERHGLVVYQAADDDSHLRAQAARSVLRRPGQIVCVSVMGPHKNVESVVRAIHSIYKRGESHLRLYVVGSWPDARYEAKIRKLVVSLGLTEVIHLVGFVSREQLDRYYAESEVFCLMSRCESFGIPAIEAQLFGTPVVSSKVCAIPEICGAGGVFCDPDDVTAIADHIHKLLHHPQEWQRLSDAARLNAAGYSWAACSEPLIRQVAAWAGV